jgi:hypothetical protein
MVAAKINVVSNYRKLSTSLSITFARIEMLVGLNRSVNLRFLLLLSISFPSWYKYDILPLARPNLLEDCQPSLANKLFKSTIKALQLQKN